MVKKGVWFLLPAVVMLTAAARYLGGWAVITVDDLPDYVTVGQPVKLSFMVRQHGMTLLDGLSPRIQARSGSTEAVSDATPVGLLPGRGHYTATVVLPKAGDWTLTIRSSFGASNATLLPIRAVDSRAGAPPSLAEYERGRRLFIAKGCFTCHVNTEATSQPGIAVGPVLTERRYPADYLSKLLANPEVVRPPRPGAPTMPNLGLKEREIASLVAFINADRQVSAR